MRLVCEFFWVFLLGSTFASITPTSVSTPLSSASSSHTSLSTSTPPVSASYGGSTGNGTCEARTINYITDTLPQQCLKSAWSANNGTTTAKTVEGEATAAGYSTASAAESTGIDVKIDTTIGGGNKTEEKAAEAVQDELDASFLSFEEWKQQQVLEKEKEKEKEKAGHKEAGSGHKKSGEGGIPHESPTEEEHREVDSGTPNTQPKAEETGEKEQEHRQEEVVEDKLKKKDHSRPRDAGKTCKERFSYASFDAGATILKTHKGAKNSKAVLIENKDSYMLSECSVENKFILIELSEEIWIDTLVLANYEFFSSMIRTFRVSVSDRYPVPLHKWKDLGTYEARNSRDIQAFLIENPQIWARYIRIEFLSHYGNEYYCPLSLVRVHGTRMLESWKETELEAQQEEEEDDEEEKESEHGFVPEAVADVVKKEEEERLKAAAAEALESAAKAEQSLMEASPIGNSTEDVTPWEKSGFYLFELEDGEFYVCVPEETPVEEEPVAEGTRIISVEFAAGSACLTTLNSAPSSDSSVASTPHASSNTTDSPRVPTSSISSIAGNTTSIAESPSSTPIATIQSDVKPNITSTAASKNKTATSTSSSASSLPTIQESFFKAVSRRLSLLESNSTLSHHYLTSQLQRLHTSFNTLSKASLTKTTSYLNELNSTVIEELRGFRQQYDEIWQSTVISLESQREENRRENRELRELVGVLAGEVVWQRRMSIVQSVLLLFCLGLVIFSRASSSEATPFYGVRRSTTFNTLGSESPVEDGWDEEDMERPNTSQSLSASPSYREALTPPSSHSPPPSRSETLAIPITLKRSKSTSGDDSYLSASPASSFNEPSSLADRSPEHERQQLTPTKQTTPFSQQKKRKNSNPLSKVRESFLTNSKAQTSPVTTPTKRGSVGSSNPFSIFSPNGAGTDGASSSSRKRTKSNASSLRRGNSSHGQEALLSPSPTPSPEPESRVEGLGMDDAGAGGGGSFGRNRGFSIARKPLPALPQISPKVDA